MVITVVIPTLRPEFNVERLIESINHSEFSSQAIDLIVVGNKIKSLHYLKKMKTKWQENFYDLRVLCTGIKSANVARNSGIRLARGELVFFIDDDCIVADRFYFSSMVNYMKEHPEVDALGGCYQLDESYSQREIDKTYAHLAKHWLDHATFNDKGQSQYLIGGNCCYRALLFREGYSFDPAMAFGGTETSLNSQLVSQGKVLIYKPELQLKHRFRVSLYQFIKKAYAQGRGKAHNLRYNQLVERSQRVEFPFSNLYTGLYDYFFQLGLKSDAKAKGFDGQRLGQFLELLFFPPRVQNTIKHYYFMIRHRIVMAAIFFYYRVLYKIFCKIYYMSEYHWRVYFRPFFLWVKRLLRGQND